MTDLEDRRGRRVFSGNYRWYYYQNQRSWEFDPAFVRRLNEVAWVPDPNGTVQPPGFIAFKDTRWKESSFLLSKIRFKPPIIEALAREAGIEPGVLDLLKKLGVTSEAELKVRLGIKDDLKLPEVASGPGDVGDALKKLLGDAPKPTPPVPDPAGTEPSGSRGGGTGGPGAGGETGSGGSGESARGGKKGAGSDEGGHKRTPGGGGARPFVSYLGTHPDDEGPDPDGLDHEVRMAVEDKAIAVIPAREPDLRRTATNNPGFDLVALNAIESPIKWVEVKAMTGTMQDRPVGLSRTQFEAARAHGPDYWLYIVELAGSPDQARIVRIQDPAGRARTFTLDHGWRSVAEPDGAAGTTTEEHGEE